MTLRGSSGDRGSLSRRLAEVLCDGLVVEMLGDGRVHVCGELLNNVTSIYLRYYMGLNLTSGQLHIHIGTIDLFFTISNSYALI